MLICSQTHGFSFVFRFFSVRILEVQRAEQIKSGFAYVENLTAVGETRINAIHKLCKMNEKNNLFECHQIVRQEKK